MHAPMDHGLEISCLFYFVSGLESGSTHTYTLSVSLSLTLTHFLPSLGSSLIDRGEDLVSGQVVSYICLVGRLWRILLQRDITIKS